MAQATIPCDLCRSEENVSFYCINCEETLCERCYIAHINSKKTKNDKVVPLSEANREGHVKSPTILCDQHPSEEVMLYCENCKQFICTLCMEESHKGHNLITLKTVKDTRIETINQLKRKLDGKVSLCANALDTEAKVYAFFSDCIEKRRNKISEQKVKITEEFHEEINNICEVYFAELTSLQQNEDIRYRDSCSNIKAQDNRLREAIQSLDTSLASGNPVSMTEVTEHINGAILELHEPRTQQIRNPKFQEVNITREAILQKMFTKGEEVEPKLATNVSISDNTNNSNRDQQSTVNAKTEESDITHIKKLFEIKLKGRYESITVIIALGNGTFWVACTEDKHLSLIGYEGKVLKESLKHTLVILDVKQYKNEFLVTFVTGKTMIKMSTDGQSESVFSDLSPYFTGDLCVTSELDVLVCLTSLTDKSDNKVVRLGSSGEIIQTIQYNKNGDPLYSNPCSVTSFTSGEIVVADYESGIVCVSCCGDHVFTWKGEVDGNSDRKFKPNYVTHDNSNNLYVADCSNDKIYVLQKQGTGARCLMDKSQGIIGPLRVTMDITGNLMVGCEPGKIHVFFKKL